jgi:hypothetical protein
MMSPKIYSKLGIIFIELFCVLRFELPLWLSYTKVLRPKTLSLILTLLIESFK